MPGTLFVVATPIGNLEDITFRAVRVLAEVDLIAAEDTRHSKILLMKYQINTPLTSYHKFNIKGKTPYLLEQLQLGKNIALISDSGMPGVSDPGAEIIREAVGYGFRIEVIPGPSASLAALAASGLPMDRFIFEGFLPKKPGKKRKALERLKAETATIIIYESPFRVLKTVAEISAIMGERRIAVCRELTKKFEEIIRGTAGEVAERLKAKQIKGEIVIVVSGQVTQRESN
ncbi:MAG: 16S rRNA (cytidine(1402)-2'-O)-methyltransferase [Candidatus Margulisbacteria bacterium]|jgi:16S rRNA (cytidine1402-2'-O)-methyltransferase|nr:16S rRNA (cytidine(1402)-2'-O)-methyltransferase [Candidatus Margulisiibacteriota bacterium]